MISLRPLGKALYQSTPTGFFQIVCQQSDGENLQKPSTFGSAERFRSTVLIENDDL